MKYKAIRGMSDIFAPDVRAWQCIEQVARDFFNARSYNEIRTPILEKTELFTRSIGEETDIVHKEMYTFPDRKGRELTLRPEMTAAVVRAVIENQLISQDEVSRFYYMGPMFRAERPQAGRKRQFHQIGLELFGDKNFYQDAEVILAMGDFFRAVGLTEDDFTIKVNSIGCKDCRDPYYVMLKDYLAEHEDQLCDDCKRRILTNTLRVLDCKVKQCKSVCAKAPKIVEHLCEPCDTYMKDFVEQVSLLGIDYVLDPMMVRGLDYYCGPVFEVVSEKLGAQDAIAAGGRYDGLVKACGGPDIGGIGFALGVERLMLVLADTDAFKKMLEHDFRVYLAHTDSPESKQSCMRMYADLTRSGISVFLDMSKGSMKSQLRQANRIGMNAVVIAGDEELTNSEVSVKNMHTSEQSLVKIEEIRDALHRIKQTTQS